MRWQTIDSLPDQFPGLEQIPRGVMYVMGCRGFNQFCSTLRGLMNPDRFCPFCPIERSRRKSQPVVTMSGWMLLQNEFPHTGTRQMWLILPLRHIADTAELSTSDWQEIGELYRYCREHYVQSGGLAMRFGDPSFHAGTIEHLHINIIEPTCGVDYSAVFAKDRKWHEEDYQRTIAFRDRIRERGGLSWLFSHEVITETQT